MKSRSDLARHIGFFPPCPRQLLHKTFNQPTPTSSKAYPSAETSGNLPCNVCTGIIAWVFDPFHVHGPPDLGALVVLWRLVSPPSSVSLPSDGHPLRCRRRTAMALRQQHHSSALYNVGVFQRHLPLVPRPVDRLPNQPWGLTDQRKPPVRTAWAILCVGPVHSFLAISRPARIIALRFDTFCPPERPKRPAVISSPLNTRGLEPCRMKYDHGTRTQNRAGGTFILQWPEPTQSFLIAGRR